MKIKTEPKPKAFTPLEMLALETAHQFAHQNSAVVMSKMRMLRCEAEETDKSITALDAALRDKKELRKRVEAQLTALSVVLAKRTVI